MSKKNETTITFRAQKDTSEKLNKICEAQQIDKSVIFQAVVRKIINIPDSKELETFLKAIGLEKKSVWSL